MWKAGDRVTHRFHSELGTGRIVSVQGRSLKAQLKGAGKRGVPWVVIAGSDEAERGKVSVRHMESGSQAEYAPEEVALVLRRGGFDR